MGTGVQNKLKINLSHGNGAAETTQLIESVFMREFKNKWNEKMEDSALLDIDFSKGSKLIFTTDSFVVKPLIFPGGDIGKLAVCGTVNDLLTTGGKPLYLSTSFIIEEGTDTETLSKIAISMRQTADEAGVYIVTGDTKVIEGNGGVYINTSGVGIVNNPVSIKDAKPQDAIIVTGNLGDHHACIMSSRMEIKNDIKSDAAPLSDIVQNLCSEKIPIHGMRDITRGGLATVLNEIAKANKLKAVINETAIPIFDSVRGLCGILGLDPLYMGNEGKMLIIVPKPYANNALKVISNSKYGQDAGIIGYFTEEDVLFASNVLLKTKLGGTRIIPPLSGEGLPRIC